MDILTLKKKKKKKKYKHSQSLSFIQGPKRFSRAPGQLMLILEVKTMKMVQWNNHLLKCDEAFRMPSTRGALN